MLLLILLLFLLPKARYWTGMKFGKFVLQLNTIDWWVGSTIWWHTFKMAAMKSFHKKNLKLCYFKSDRDEIWQECSKYALIDGSRISSMTPCFQGVGHDVGSCRKVLPPGEITCSICPMHMVSFLCIGYRRFHILSPINVIPWLQLPMLTEENGQQSRNWRIMILWYLTVRY